VTDDEQGRRCAWCRGPLPAPIDSLAVVHGSSGEIMATCSTACLAELVADLTEPIDESRRHLAGRRN
jgi:hypothetical protein